LKSSTGESFGLIRLFPWLETLCTQLGSAEPAGWSWRRSWATSVGTVVALTQTPQIPAARKDFIKLRGPMMTRDGDRSVPKSAPAGGEYYVFRDAIHNLIEIDDSVEGRYVRSILGTTELQRLRRIRQNGLSALVYQSLEGSRFPHALGAFHISRKIIRHLRQNQPSAAEGFPDAFKIDERTAMAFPLAALLHDIAHGPLSHVWEDIFSTHHEDAGVAILRNTPTRLHKLLSKPSDIDADYAKFDEILDEVLKFLDKTHQLYFLIPLIAGHLDVDRLDFMARDTRAAGVTYGFHDLEWIIRSLRFARIPARVLSDGRTSLSRWVVAVDGRKGLNTLVQFLRARENMYGLVYHHKTTRAAQCLLSKIFCRAEELARASYDLPMPTPYLLRWLKGERTPEALMKLGDEDVACALKLWAESKDQLLSSLSQKFLERDLYKVVEVSLEIANLLKQIDSVDHGQHLLMGVENILEEADKSGLPEQKEYWYGFDATHFDLIGDPSRDDQDPIWIIQFGRFGLEYTPLRDYWVKRFGGHDLTAENHYIHCFNAATATAVQTYVGRLPSFSTQQGDIEPVQVGTYKPLRLISKSGANKEVYLGVNTEPGTNARSLVAMKYYKDATSVDRDLSKPNLILEGADRRNITLASGYKHSSDPRQYVLVESCWHASLEALVLQDGLRRELEEIFDLGRQLFRGLSILHERNIRHTDIKLDNCGYSYDRRNRVYKIGDFGCMSIKPSELPVGPLIGTKRTMAPERLINPPKIGIASDVWALGVTVYALCSGEYWFIPITVPHKGEGRAEEVEIALADRERSVAADVSGAVSDFRSRASTKLPPILWKHLSPCFADVEKRASASAVAAAFDAAYQELVAKPTLERAAIRTLWREFEDLNALADKSNLSLLRESHKDFAEYVPGTLWNA
jgi:HD superfamily phosphohydrolase/serine/threonine protein kinase